MNRYYYADSLPGFLHKDRFAIFGELTANNQFTTEDLQKSTWLAEIDILKRETARFSDGHILFEYTIPRIGDRVDNIVLYQGIVFLLEFKVGEHVYSKAGIDQVMDYALDLRCFHKESHNKFIVPVLVATEAPFAASQIQLADHRMLAPLLCNQKNLGSTLADIAVSYGRPSFAAKEWIDSLYMPTPTIIEAAQALYRGHGVEDISRNDASAINLSRTTDAINRIIDFSKANHRKSICFVTGVPGAGKTLAGLNLSVERQRIDENEHAVFLSGNFPLVAVLQEALARDKCRRSHILKSSALREVKDFIQIIHHFRDDAISTAAAPYEKVAIFDEAQRAWTKEQLSRFMKEKKGIFDFAQSEPEFLISIMDRHTDWAVVVCLIGGGQEINTGEAGLSEWFKTIKDKYSFWDVYVSDKITDAEYLSGIQVEDLQSNLHIERDLHLAVSLRSFRSEKVSAFVKAFLDVDRDQAKALYAGFKDVYPVVMTRDLKAAKAWIHEKAKGSQRYGVTASSGAGRLRTHGIWVQSKIDAPTWFLNGKDDVRSSYYLEETATEFDIQGLELDWSIVCWDANMRFNGVSFEYFNFRGNNWEHVVKPIKAQYLKNAYRVLLTRARQGFVIFIPDGNITDPTRDPAFYNGIYGYLKDTGIPEIRRNDMTRFGSVQ
jgi:hypothetical protein